VCCSVLQCVAVCCSVLPCVAVCCSVLQCATVYCSVLQCAAVCCSMLQCLAVHVEAFFKIGPQKHRPNTARALCTGPSWWAAHKKKKKRRVKKRSFNVLSVHVEGSRKLIISSLFFSWKRETWKIQRHMTDIITCGGKQSIVYFLTCFSKTWFQPIADRVAQNLEIISNTLSTHQDSAHGIYD